jgi:hypothetical protein
MASYIVGTSLQAWQNMKSQTIAKAIRVSLASPLLRRWARNAADSLGTLFISTGLFGGEWFRDLSILVDLNSTLDSANPEQSRLKISYRSN